MKSLTVSDEVHVTLQVVSQYSSTLSPLCVDAVMKVIDPAVDNSVDLRDIRVIQKLGYVTCSVRVIQRVHSY